MVKRGLNKKFLIASLLSIVSIAVVIAIALGQPAGIAVTRNDSASSAVTIYYNGTYNEDVAWMINLSINNTLLKSTAGMNVTEFNITLPTGFTFSSGTNNASSHITGIINQGNFTNTSSLLKWINTSTNGVVVAANATCNLSSYLSFVVTAANPGIFNMTLRWRNGTTAETENITIIINDTTAPTRDWASNTFANYSNNSKYGIIANLTITDNWASELPNNYSMGENGILSEGTVNITLMDVNFLILNSSTAMYYLLNTTASIYANFTN